MYMHPNTPTKPNFTPGFLACKTTPRVLLCDVQDEIVRHRASLKVGISRRFVASVLDVGLRPALSPYEKDLFAGIVKSTRFKDMVRV